MTGIFERLAAWFRKDEVREATLAAETEDDVERERLEQDYQAKKDDVAAAEGTGMGMPIVGPGTTEQVYHEFQSDEDRPADPAP
jgi:hypothetical protein